MPENASNGTANGAILAVPDDTAPVHVDRYRPEASTTAVHDTVLTSLASVVTAAVHHAGHYVYLADHYDRDATTAVRLGHLVDATECVEIAMTHLGQLKAAMSHRLRLEDEHHAGETPY